jgi:hypothetical protein
MKAVLINKTDVAGHHGCTLVNRQIDALAKEAGITIVANLPLNSDWDGLAPKKFDTIIVNGEGTLHSSKDGARRIAEVPAWANRRGVSAHLINSVYQNNGSEIIQGISRFQSITVRDQKSARELQGSGVECRIIPDLSLTWKVQAPQKRGKSIIVNGSVIESVRRDLYALSNRTHPYLPIKAAPPCSRRKRIYELRRTLTFFHPPSVKRARYRNAIPTFESFVSYLRKHAAGIITGRFHMCTIALCLEIPVVAVPSNTHKIEALFDEIEMPERALDPENVALQHPHEYTSDEISRIRDYRQMTTGKSNELFAFIAQT